MLSYQHIYHAGNFADVQKHSLLIRLLDTLTQGDAPLHVLDTHAGRGFYDLSGREAEKTGEHAFGVTPLWHGKRKHSPLIARYLDVIAGYNRTNKGDITRYPGSARITRDILRPNDTLVAAERHPGEFAHLSRNLRDADTRTTDLFHDDGLIGLQQATPPAGAQGLAIIDPSYEVKSDYAEIPDALARAWHLWPQSTALIWYPILPAAGHTVLLEELGQNMSAPLQVSEIYLTTPPKPNFRMQGSGIVLVNPPWDATVTADLTTEIATALTSTRTCGDVTADSFSL